MFDLVSSSMEIHPLLHLTRLKEITTTLSQIAQQDHIEQEPHILAYLATALCERGLQDQVRLLAGELLERHAKLMTAESSFATATYVRNLLLQALRDPKRSIRDIAGQAVVAVFTAVQLHNWRDGFLTIVGILEETVEMQETSLFTLYNLCTKEAMALDEELCHSLLRKLFKFTFNLLPQFRVLAVLTLSCFLGNVSLNVEDFIAHLWALSPDETIAVRQSVCHAFVRLIETFPSKVTPNIVACVVNFATRANRHIKEAVMKFIGCAARLDGLAITLVPMMHEIVPIILDGCEGQDHPASDTTRKAATDSLKALATKFAPQLMSFLRPALQLRLTSQDRKQNETAIIVVGTIARVHLEAVTPDFPILIPHLIDLLSRSDPPVQSSAYWALRPAINWIVKPYAPDARKSMILLPFVDNFLCGLMDTNTCVKEAAISLLGGLQTPANPRRLPSHVTRLLDTVIPAYVEPFDTHTRRRIHTLLSIFAHEVGESSLNERIVPLLSTQLTLVENTRLSSLFRGMSWVLNEPRRDYRISRESENDLLISALEIISEVKSDLDSKENTDMICHKVRAFGGVILGLREDQCAGQFRGTLEDSIDPVVSLLTDEHCPEQLRITLALILGHIGLVFPTIVVPYLPAVAPVWFHSLQIAAMDEFKTFACEGLQRVAALNVGGITNGLYWFCSLLFRTPWENPETQPMLLDLLQKCKTRDEAEWALQVQNLPPHLQVELSLRKL
ncbi:hypothetical protein VNI00_015498 [Paramarasmius palmivorus]|uniref:Uncharacterized protein n=1 Tax=Paramarasmius palmivorus TaxID=297713 RepID=A0AAW0BN27_9AGAR